MKKVLLLLLLPVLAIFAQSCETEDTGSGNQPEPQISEIVTDYDGKAVSGKPVTLIGTNFSPKASENQVLYGVGLNSTSLRVTESSETHVVFTAPQVSGNQLRVRVSVNGKESNSVVLEFDNSLSEDGPVEPQEDEVDLSAMLAKATVVKVREGIEWIHFEGVWEGQTRNINIVKTTLNEHNKVGLYYDYKSVDDGYNINDKCEYLDAIVGTNGPMACCHYVRVDGAKKRGANGQDPWIVNAALTIHNGVPDIIEIKDNFEAAGLKNIDNIGVGGPMLVYNGRICEDQEDFKNEILPVWKNHENWNGGAFINTTHPRTAFGISKDQKTVYHVVVDGRWSKAVGMQTRVLAKLMRGLGCYKALNFDGGGGTAMYIYGHGLYDPSILTGIVNHPCDPQDDGKRYWSNPRLRPCGNAVYIKSDLK
jgi:hypothetical protein